MSISDNNTQTCGQEITIISATPPLPPKTTQTKQLIKFTAMKSIAYGAFDIIFV